MRSTVTVGALALAAVLLAPAVAASAAPTPSATPSPAPTASSTASPPTEPDPLASTIKRTYSYGRKARQRMDVWWEPGAGRRPAVFILHGGWWSSGDKKYMTAVSRSYAALGYTVFNLNYRLSTEAAWPAQRTDTLAAITLARKHADFFSFDPDRYVVLGFSAGGHIATAVGTYRDGVPGLRGVVGVSPVVSPLTAYSDGDEGADYDQRKLRRSAIALAGGCRPTGRCAQVWSSMEVPWHASAHDAPVLSVHSADEFVPAYQSELLKEELAQVGVPMEIRVQPGWYHSSPLYREPGVAEYVQEWIAGRLATSASGQGASRPSRTSRGAARTARTDAREASSSYRITARTPVLH
ncbi:alpha/beta hydrolase [Sphaerisporangium siamense]|uniref:Acetyl esterase/lipase n=1 Tax=Sphaerisporangium siamense TaxID=795645 RepID=A0A7W7D6A8_9ACTN|nr:alpha/beta hydrolase [Sphaerisporangium siamense]MBB4701099.1 acetyl esterase/lipase [Sphaerisporangium siamense]